MTESKRCGVCRYWSEMIARAGAGTSNPGGAIEAMCTGSGPNMGLYTTSKDSCHAFREGAPADGRIA